MIHQSGYYYNEQLNKIAQLHEGERFPQVGTWTLVGTLHEITPLDALARIQVRHPDVTIELVFIKK